MANYFTNAITFSSPACTASALEDLYNHILTAVQISKSFDFRPPWLDKSRWTKYYTVAMTYGVQTIYDIGRCTVLDVGAIIDNGRTFGLVPPPKQFMIIAKTAFTPMIVFWVDLINTFYQGKISISWRSYAEENYVITNTETEQNLYSMTVLSEGDNVIKLDRLYDTKNAPFYRIIPIERGGDYRLEKIASNGNTILAFEDYQTDFTEADCIGYLRRLSSKYDDMQNLWQVMTDSKYMFDGDLLISQDSFKTTEEMVDDDLDCWASVQDPETLEGLDFDDRVYKAYDDPRLFVKQQPSRPEPCNQQQFPDCTDGNIIN